MKESNGTGNVTTAAMHKIIGTVLELSDVNPDEAFGGNGKIDQHAQMYCTK